MLACPLVCTDRLFIHVSACVCVGGTACVILKTALSRSSIENHKCDQQIDKKTSVYMAHAHHYANRSGHNVVKKPSTSPFIVYLANVY